MIIAIKTLKEWFSKLKKPTGSQFAALIDSFWHKSETIPVKSIEGINEILVNKADQSALDGLVVTEPMLSEALKTKVNKVGGTLKDVTANGNTTPSAIIVQEAVISRDIEKKNLIFGKNALTAATAKAKNNMAIGDNALAANEESPENTAVGINALVKLKTGDWNTALGFTAGQNIEHGLNSTFVGAGAGQAAVQSDMDTFLGMAGYSYKGDDFTTGDGKNKKGGKNVMVGASAGYYMRSGYGNTFVGASAGQNWKSTGSYNTVLGHGAGALSTSINGDCNVLIGSFVPASGSMSNTLMVHSQRNVAEGGKITTPLILGKFDERYLRIGGRLELMYEYTPDADTNNFYKAKKVLVSDADGKVGMMGLDKVWGGSLQTITDYERNTTTNELVVKRAMGAGQSTVSAGEITLELNDDIYSSINYFGFSVTSDYNNTTITAEGLTGSYRASPESPKETKFELNEKRIKVSGFEIDVENNTVSLSPEMARAFLAALKL